MSKLDTQLALLKTDIGLMRVTAEQNSYLTMLLTMAASAIAREGIVLKDAELEDNGLVAMYAAWLYRKRQQPADAGMMPRMLRYQLNNKLVSQKMSVAP
ncbi:MAG: hypothetical protein RSG55_07005 [Oscillospiraceae bacterium]